MKDGSVQSNIVVSIVISESPQQALLHFDPDFYFAEPCNVVEYEKLGYNLDGKYAHIGWKWDPDSKKYYNFNNVRKNFILSENMKWKPPIDPPDEYATPNYYHLSEEISLRYRWDDDLEEWVEREFPRKKINPT